MNALAPPTFVPEYVYQWQVFVGSMRLFIVGPGGNAWFPVSIPTSTGQVGTFEEHKVAQDAVIIMSARHRENKDAGPDEIRQALEESGWKADHLTIYPKNK